MRTHALCIALSLSLSSAAFADIYGPRIVSVRRVPAGSPNGAKDPLYKLNAQPASIRISYRGSGDHFAKRVSAEAHSRNLTVDRGREQLSDLQIIHVYANGKDGKGLDQIQKMIPRLAL